MLNRRMYILYVPVGLEESESTYWILCYPYAVDMVRVDRVDFILFLDHNLAWTALAACSAVLRAVGLPPKDCGWILL